MARKAILEGGKRDEILDAAFALFLKSGYEGTSIRMILEQVHGEVGMFYHYFHSKQEVFDKAFGLFMKRQEQQFETLLADWSAEFSADTSLREIAVGLLAWYDRAMQDYQACFAGKVHWSVASALHDGTLQAMFPAFQKLLFHLAPSARERTSEETEWLVRFLLGGISGVLHERSFEYASADARIDFIMELLCKTMELETDL